MQLEVKSFYLPNVMGCGMTREELDAWLHGMWALENMTTDPKLMNFYERMANRRARKYPEIYKDPHHG